MDLFWTDGVFNQQRLMPKIKETPLNEVWSIWIDDDDDDDDTFDVQS